MHLYSVVKLKSLLIPALLLLLFFLINVSRANAATLTNASDTTTTSRPSPSSPNNDSAPGAAASSTQLTVYNNGSRYLASDSAKVIRTSTNAIIDQNLVVSSQSADLTGVFLGNSTSAIVRNGTDVVYVPITAMHTIQFTSAQNLTTNDDIVITFPALSVGDANNPASPSASTFQLNGITTSEIKVEDDGGNFTTFTATVTNPSAGTSPRISLNIDSGTIAPGSVVKVYLGCATWSGAACSVQAPRIINPTKNSALTCTGSPETCTASSYKIRIDTIDDGTSNTDTATVGIGINESVTIRATVDPTLTFTITGINSAVDLANGNAGCSSGAYSQLANSGINSTANNVNLGIIQNTPAAGGTLSNLAGQLISVSTNGPTGYSLTATSSGSLLNPATGFFFLTSTTPTNFAAASDFFGLHPCGNDVNNTWVEGTPGGGADCTFVSGADGGTADECLWAWPNPTNTLGGGTTLTLASDATGPVGSGTGETGDGYTSIAYGAGIDVAVPPGEYRTVITYIATPSF